MLLTWKSMCKAYQIHVLSGNASSAASAFFLSNADEYVVSDMASMMIHEYQTSNGGSNSNVIKQATHTAKENEKFLSFIFCSSCLRLDSNQHILRKPPPQDGVSTNFTT